MNRYVLIAGIICAEALGVSAQTQSKQVRRLEKQRTEMQKRRQVGSCSSYRSMVPRNISV